MIINLTGTSLLTNKLQREFGRNNAYPDDFLKCLDAELYGTLSPQERKEYINLIPLLQPDKEVGLTSLLAIPAATADLPFISAETKTIGLIISENALKPECEEITFLSSNTTECRACANALKYFYEGRFKSVKVEVIENLGSDAEQFEKGLRELLDGIIKLASTSRNNSEVIINATAGYKPEAGYAALCGLLLGVRVYYGHEQFNKIVKLPSIPVGVDFKLIHLHASKIIYALESGIKNAYDELPQVLKDLIKTTTSGFEFTEAGIILWEQYLASRSEYGIMGSKWILTERIPDESLRKKIVEFIKAWDHIWVGMQVPQMVNHTQTHCQNLLNLGEQLFLQLPKDYLCDEEMYLLIAAIWLHDIGHSEPVLLNNSGIPEWLSSTRIRKDHPLLAYQRIKYDFKYFGFETFNNEAELIALLCKYHNTKTSIDADELAGEFQFNKKTIRIKLLIGLLRMLDVSDNGIQRIGSENYRLFREKVTDSEIEKFEMLQNNIKDESAKKLFEEEIKFRKKQRDHFAAHAMVEGTSLKVNKDKGKYFIELVFHPVKAYKGKALDMIKGNVGLQKLDNAREILKDESKLYKIDDIKAVESV